MQPIDKNVKKLNPVLLNVRLFLICSLPSALIFVLDQISKKNAVRTILNEGLFLGTFGHTSPFLRICLVLSLFGIIAFISAIVQLIYIRKVPLLAFFISILMGGLAGNAYDRIVYSGVRDFLDLPFLSHLVFNGADLAQWLGIAGVIIIIWQKASVLWPEKNRRNQVQTNQGYTIRLILILVLMNLLSSSSIAIFGLAYLKSSVDFTGSESQTYVSCLILLLIIQSILVSAFGFYLSNKIYGPLIALERYLDELLQADSTHTIATSFREADDTAPYRRMIEKINRLVK